MKCVCFLQISEDSLAALEDELKEPKYGEYYLCQWVNLVWFASCKWRGQTDRNECVDFSNVLSKTAIERLAQVDEYEVVREVQVCSLFDSLYALINAFGAGIFCGLCANNILSVFPESHAFNTQAAIWLHRQCLGFEST